jgi:hypothetical protein
VKCSVSDKAGNPSGEKSDTVKIDTNAPQVTANQATTNPNGAGWYNTNVTNHFAFSDGNGSGLFNPADASINKITQGEGTTVKVNSGPVSDLAGNTNPGINSAAFKIDLSDPTNVAFVGGPAAGGSYDYGNVPAQPTCTSQDAISGPKSCVVTGYSNAVGTHTMTATATDNADRTATATRTYTVKPYGLGGFYQPVDMGGVLNTVKNGSTVPVKFELFSGATELTSTSAVSSVLAKTVDCAAFNGDPTDDIEMVTTGGTSLRYDTTGGQFIYNWQTPKKINTCYNLTMTATDGSTITAYFKLK